MDYRIIIVVIALLIIIMYIISKKNNMVKLSKKCEQAISNIDVFLTKRYDTLTKLSEVVKGYTKYEKDTLIEISKIRANMTINEIKKYNSKLDDEYNKINIIVEKYPELKADKQYLKLQEQIIDCEDNLAAARRIYNSDVNDYNNYILKFPNSFFSWIFEYKEKEYYKLETNDDVTGVMK